MFDEEYRSWSSSLCNFLYCFIVSYTLRQNISLNTLFSEIINLCSSPDMIDQVSHLHKKDTSWMTLLYHSIANHIT
jgi:hypothetical protein